MTRARPQAPKPAAPSVVDPLAEFREPDPTSPPVVKPGATGTTLPPTDDGGPIEFLYAAESLEEAIAMALLMATPENMDALAAELLIRYGPGTPSVVPLVSTDDQDEIRNQMIHTWHNNTVALGFLHKGGSCGCRYIAQAVLDVIAPTELDDVTTDLSDPTEG